MVDVACLATLRDHCSSRSSWFLELLPGCSHSSPPPFKGGGCFRSCSSYFIEATACPTQVSCDLPPFFKFVCLTDNPIEPHLSPLGIEAVTTVGGHARTLQLPDSLALVNPLCREVVKPAVLPTSRLDTYPMFYNTQAKAMSRLEFCPASLRIFRNRVGHLGATHSLQRLVRTLRYKFRRAWLRTDLESTSLLHSVLLTNDREA